MNDKSNNESDVPLKSVLQEWRINSPLPPRFQEQVWRRIERQEANAPKPFWFLMVNWFRSSVVHPRWAVAYAAILLLVGLTGGFLRAQYDNTKLDGMMQARYVQSIDPYQK